MSHAVGCLLTVICPGREDAFITRALLAQLAQRLHGHQQVVLGGGEEGEDTEATIMFNNEEGCNVQ
jgi:nuclear receptor interaction protein